jgi:CheY-like chemotaxis protein
VRRRRGPYPFFTTTGIGKGTGLGLSQVNGIARQANGSARTDSEPGKGTTARILLPVMEAPAASVNMVGVESDSPIHAGTVLVVNDDPNMQRILIDQLEALGYRADQAADGPGGLEALAQQRPDIAMIYFAMPGMNGAQVAKHISEQWPDLPIVFATGHADSMAIEKAIGLNVPMLRKPFRVVNLQAVLADVLSKRP